MTKLIKTIIQGMGIGSIIYLLMGIFFVERNTRNNIIGVLIMSGVMGVLAAVYDTKLPLLIKTLIHSLGSLAIFLAVAYLNNWFPMQLAVVASVVIIFAAIFFIIWTMFYFKYRSEVMRINDRINAKI